MTLPFIKSAFNAGELSPSLYGRIELEKWHAGCSVARNMVVSYKGGLFSRAGTLLAGMCKQPASATSVPPRIIEFRFNIYQSYILEFGDQYMRVVANGAYVTEAPFAITGINQANPGQVTAPGNNFANGDWVFAAGINGPVTLNGETFIVQNVSGSHFTLTDTFGVFVDTSSLPAWTSGGTVARIYTLATPYAAVDLPYLKYTQSADVMSLCLVNQLTQVEYNTQELTRLAANNWTLAPPNFASSIGPPTSPTAQTTGGTGTATVYSYVITAVDAITGDESVASAIASSNKAGDISASLGTVSLAWQPPVGRQVSGYNIYRCPPSYSAVTQQPQGQLFGFVGSTQGATQWQDTNIIADDNTVPPQHTNPFANGQILGATPVSRGTGYAPPTTTATMVSATGSGAVLVPIIDAGPGLGLGIIGPIAGIYIQDPGEGYLSGDTILIVDTGVVPGTGANYTPIIGPPDGNQPGVPAYFQQRRFYAESLNAPDTYEMSQPGSYTNFDAAIPPIDSDSITGTPWALEVNGVQWAINMPGGLIVATGQDCWLLSGTGGAGSPITPSQQSAQQQESNGFSPTLPPIKINYQLLFGQALGSIICSLNYNFYANIYTGEDITVLSSHLFANYQVTQWAWAREPYKVVWACRNDGKMLALTWVKAQEVQGWTRHDTNGLAVSVAVASEPPVNAVYWVMKRFIQGKGQWAYFVERMDNRLWAGIVENVWAVDCGLSLPQPQPNATLVASASAPTMGCLAGPVIQGGSNYTAPSGTITDLAGTGFGAVVSGVTVAGGAITGYTILPEGIDYLNPIIEFSDATGSGVVAEVIVDTSLTLNASAAVFTSGNVGSVIRAGGGKGTITAIVSPTQVKANMVQNITSTVPDDPLLTPLPQGSGSWTMTKPISVVNGLGNLEGMKVTGLADGNVIPLTTVVGGQITLNGPASAIVVGLPFLPQAQSMHADIPGQMIQGKRKRVQGVTLRLAETRGIKIGQDQPIAAVQPNQAELPWNVSPNLMTEQLPYNATLAAGVAAPLFTGDVYISVAGDYSTTDNQPSPGMVAVQQDFPLPLEILAFVPEIDLGDMPDAPK